MKNQTKRTACSQRDFSLDVIILSVVALTSETIGRKIFLEHDTNIAIYSARYWMDNDGPWNSALIGWELVIGSISNLIGQPEGGIWIVGVVVNILATLSVYLSGIRCQFKRSTCIAASLATALWFMPPIGGWSGDHLSFLVGIAPAVVFFINHFKWPIQVSIMTGAALAYGLTLKLNSYMPAAAVAGITIVYYLLLEAKQFFYKKILVQTITIASSFLVCCIALEKLIRIDNGLYNTIFNFYSNLSNSEIVENRLSLTKLVLIPLNQNFLEGFTSGQKGVMIFAPLAALFWVSIAVCIYKQIIFPKAAPSYGNLTSSHNMLSKKNSVILLFLICSALSCLTLGRGLSHRLFLLPAGIIYASDFWALVNFKQFKIYGKWIILSYLIFIWICLGAIQARDGWNSHIQNRDYYVGTLIASEANQKKLCVTNAGAHNKAKHTGGLIYSILGSSGKSLSKSPSNQICWNKDEIRDQFAGLGRLNVIANLLSVSFRNQIPTLGGDAYLVESWNSELTSSIGREKWAQRNAEIINNMKFPYLIEKIVRTNITEYFPREWLIGRQSQLTKLVDLIGAEKVGSVEGYNIWKTKWHEKE